ncbi:mitochondrial ribonuclease P catalytic subunit [Protopterus annectens]|uniref:mitochondrial ribonuclease P catalytic subunit n=1 Tax=Protopterus annectens TaxID=7888 RepID=UPI001CF9C124|nr:mitochondrial ribonuclease P catalytic subunit [Protopterus annectens]
MNVLLQACLKGFNVTEQVLVDALQSSKYVYFTSSHFRFSTSRFQALKECKDSTERKKVRTENVKLKFGKRDRGCVSVFLAGSAKRRAENNVNGYNKLAITDVEPKTERIKIPTSPLNVREWKELKDESGNLRRFEIRVMELLLSKNGDISVGKSLLNFVVVENGTIEYELLLKYLALCVQQNNSAEIFDVYDIMKTAFKTLDTGAYRLLIKGFSRTERLAECLSCLESIKKVITPSSRNYGDVMVCALAQKEANTAWSLYEEMLRSNLIPNLETIEALFSSGRNFSDTDYTTKLINTLLLLRDNQIFPDESLMLAVKSWFESLPGQQWEGQLTAVPRGSQCPSCGTQLESILLSEEEYLQLQSRIMNDVIHGTDVFKKTTPEELERFQKFVKRCPPFDVVIDGLNVANISSKERQSQTLLDVVSYLANQGQRLLVLGRKHMLKETHAWKRHHIATIQDKATCFFTENVSEDDPFLLYATLHSGNHCKFLSRDLMRDHKACLPDSSTRRLFFKWQRGHQLVISSYIPGKKIMLQVTPNVDTIIQTTGDSWHIPYDERGVERYSYEVPRKWLCLIRKEFEKH